MIRGSCLCGKVRCQLDAAPQFINLCHGSICRKVHGAACGSFLHADGLRFQWLAGEPASERFASSPANARAFCKTCGSSVPVLEEDGTHLIIPAGSLDDNLGERPAVHIHSASKAPWYKIIDTLPQFTGFPPTEFRDSVG